MRLTNARAKAATNDSDKAIWLYDDELTGFALSISPKGKKTWYLDAWANGRKNRTKIGNWPEVNATEARDQAKDILGQLTRGKEYQRKAKARKLTLGDLWDYWFLNHSKPKKRTWERDQREYERFVRPVLHHVLLADIERADIVKMLTNIEGEYSIGAARKTRSLLSAMFERAIKNNWMTDNPVRQTERPSYEPRQRYLKPEEVSAFFGAVNSLRSKLARDFLLMCLWTGGRRDNVGSMEWAEIDAVNKTWTIPARKYKGKKPHFVPLSEPALEILNRRRESRLEGAKYVFPSRSSAGYYKWPKDAWQKVLEISGIEDLRIHDLRRSMGAWMNNAGDSLRTIQQALGHANVATTATFYTPPEDAPVRKSVDAVAAAMLAAAKGGDR